MPGPAGSKGNQEANTTRAPQPVVRAGFRPAARAPWDGASLNGAQRDTAVRFFAQDGITRPAECRESVGLDIALTRSERNRLT
jgi:hypothetical protein